LLEHLFRHQAGRIVAHLTGMLGPSRLNIAEESVQEAMLRALQTWPYQGILENQSAWLFRVARNAAIDALRRDRLTASLEDVSAAVSRLSTAGDYDAPDFEEQLRDDELRMIFMCCHPEIPHDSRVALSLKTVGGFSVREIARAFLADDATVAQRLVRAKRHIRDHGLTLEMPRGADLECRIDSVAEVLYFLFNEGYAAHEGQDRIRQDLCFEALRLGSLLTSSSIATPGLHALQALMCFQAARLAVRTDEIGDIVLLENQDRSRWDQHLIALGFHHFDLSMTGERVSEYHVQAAIAATHARLSGAAPVHWPIILELYDQLYALNASPVIALNRAVAIAKVRGASEALAAIEPLGDNAKLRDYYLFLAVRGHLLQQMGAPEAAAECFRSALERRCSEPERRFLLKKLAECAP
jgi:RNA polymerase sigma-70 factor (ECF subfamily)